MADFNQVLEVGDWQQGLVNTVVEIPQGSNLKIEWDRERAAFMLDRVEPQRREAVLASLEVLRHCMDSARAALMA